MLVILTCPACNQMYQRSTPAQAYQRWTDRLSVAIGLPAFGCYHEEKTELGKVSVGIRMDRCVKFDPRRRWQGVWRNEFEDSRFCPAPAKQCNFDTPGDRLWLNASIPFPEAIKERRFGGLYAIQFVGRKTKYRGSYGHLGGSDQEIIVDRLISIARSKPSEADEGRS